MSWAVAREGARGWELVGLCVMGWGGRGTRRGRGAGGSQGVQGGGMVGQPACLAVWGQLGAWDQAGQGVGDLGHQQGSVVFCFGEG